MLFLCGDAGASRECLQPYLLVCPTVWGKYQILVPFAFHTHAYLMVGFQIWLSDNMSLIFGTWLVNFGCQSFLEHIMKEQF